jgi:polyisoprenoid-binding protein YceI
MTATTPLATSVPLAPGRWTLDAAHSGIYFLVRHLGLSNVRGRFDRFDASLEVGPTLDDVAVTAEVDMASVDTNHPDRDAHLRSTDFFDADRHPSMTFRSTAIRGAGEEYELTGDLTINGVIQPITLDVEFSGTEVHPADGRVRAGFAARGTLSRRAFGVDFNMPLGADKVALGEKVRVELDLQFIAPEI